MISIVTVHLYITNPWQKNGPLHFLFPHSCVTMNIPAVALLCLELAPSGRSDPPQDFQPPAPPRREDTLRLLLQSPSPGLHLGPSTIVSTLAPSSLVSAVVHHPTGSTRLLCPSGSTFVSCRPSATSGLHSTCFASSLCPSGSVWLLLPSSSSFILSRSGSAAVFYIPASVAWAFSSALALRTSASSSLISGPTSGFPLAPPTLHCPLDSFCFCLSTAPRPPPEPPPSLLSWTLLRHRDKL